jgi:hypothetical protein
MVLLRPLCLWPTFGREVVDSQIRCGVGVEAPSIGLWNLRTSGELVLHTRPSSTYHDGSWCDRRTDNIVSHIAGCRRPWEL